MPLERKFIHPRRKLLQNFSLNWDLNLLHHWFSTLRPIWLSGSYRYHAVGYAYCNQDKNLEYRLTRNVKLGYEFRPFLWNRLSISNHLRTIPQYRLRNPSTSKSAYVYPRFQLHLFHVLLRWSQENLCQARHKEEQAHWQFGIERLGR